MGGGMPAYLIYFVTDSLLCSLLLIITTTNARCRPGGQTTTIAERARSDYSMLVPDIDMTAVQARSKTSFSLATVRDDYYYCLFL